MHTSPATSREASPRDGCQSARDRDHRHRLTGPDVADEEVVGLTAAYEIRAASLSMQRDLRTLVLAFTPDERFIISTNGNSNDVSVIDVAAEEVIKSVPVGQQPWGVVVAPN